MAEAQPDGQRPSRPFSVTLVLLGVFLIGLANGWRALGLVRQSSLLLEAGATRDPRLCALGSLAWALLFVVLAFAVWRRKRYSRFVVPLALLAYGLYVFVLPGPCAPVNRLQYGVPVDGIVYVVAFLFTILALNLASARDYFKKQANRRTRNGDRPSRA